MALTTTSLPACSPARSTQQLLAPAVNAYQQLVQVAREMFEPEELGRLAPRVRRDAVQSEGNGRSGRSMHPLAATEAIAYDFLTKGGKHSRPFITLATYHALRRGKVSAGNGQPLAENGDGFVFSDAVKRTAMSIEIFHKASLVHDDIEDDDAYRYGEETLHRRFGTPTAINVGDYLIGMGYRMLSGEAAQLGAETVVDILNRMADAHVKLTEGQGAELLWRDSLNKQLTTADAIHIYELKTAPAFEAALYSGMRLAGLADEYRGPVHDYARNLGVAFQILNDLGDWLEDDHNKLAAGGDVLGGRPTVLWALALEGLSEPDRAELVGLANPGTDGGRESLARVRQLYERAGVFDQAAQLVEQHRDQAVAVARRAKPVALNHLLLYLVEKVLAGPETAGK